MPQIPAATGPTVAPVGASGVFSSIDARPESFGAQSAAAMGTLGQTLERAGDTAAQDALRFQRQYNETASDQALTSFDTGARTLHGDFKDLQGADALSAREGALKKIEQLRQDTRASLKNPEAQRMFDYMSRRAAKGYADSIDNHARTEFRVWQGDTAKGAIENEVNNSAENWSDNTAFAQSLGNVKIQAAKLLALKGIDPASDAGKAEITHYTSEAWTARIGSVMAQDAGIAREIFNANADQIDAKHRAVLDARITSAQYTQMQRDVTIAQRADANVQREQRQTQATNFAALMADEFTGKAWDMQHIADMVRLQQLPEHALTAARSVRIQNMDAPSNPRALTSLYARLNDPDNPLTVAEVQQHAGRDIHGTAAVALIQAINSKEKRGDNALDRANYAELKTVLSGHAIEQGLIRDPTLASHQTALWAQAQGEWTNRVLVKGEASSDVLADMMPRYAKTPQVPGAWPQPRMGAVASSQDVPKVMQATKAAFDAGTITKAQFDAEGGLLLKYSNFYRDQDARLAAVKAKQPASGERAKLKGVSNAEGQ